MRQTKIFETLITNGHIVELHEDRRNVIRILVKLNKVSKLQPTVLAVKKDARGEPLKPNKPSLFVRLQWAEQSQWM